MEQIEDGKADHNVLAVPVGQGFGVRKSLNAIEPKHSEYVVVVVP